MSEVKNWLKYFQLCNIENLSKDSNNNSYSDEELAMINKYKPQAILMNANIFHDNDDARLAYRIFTKQFDRTILYRYVKISDNTLKMIINNQVWLSEAKDFNDPFEIIQPLPLNFDEFLINYKQLKRNDPALRIDSLSHDEELEAVKIRYKEDPCMAPVILPKIKILCFSKLNNNILMWSHYTDAHKGLCFEFDVTEDATLFLETWEVKYTENYPQIKLKVTPTNYEGVTDCLATKYIDWGYEKEYRITKYLPDRNLHDFNKKSLKSIIFGWKAEYEEIKTIQNLIINTKCYEHDVFKGAVKMPNSFK